MCRVFLYSRVSTSAQTLAQQERTAYEWLKAHNMEVDEVVSDEGISGGVSYADRNLGKVLLPKTKEGDMIIVSEVSRLGRSMYNLSELIHKELKPRKIRLVCVNMGIDLNCAKMTAIDELIISNFSFAAQLEKQLISERTLSALAVKRKQGVKFGRANEKYKTNYNKKTNMEKRREGQRKGLTKNARHLESKDMQAFIKVLKSVFPEATAPEDMMQWDWKGINTKKDNRDKVLKLMIDYKALDSTLFVRWKFQELDDKQFQMKLASHIANLHRSVKTREYLNNIFNKEQNND